MSATNTTNWIRAGLMALPVSGLLTFWSSLHPQPDPTEDYEAWAHFVSTPHYMLGHLIGSGGGLILGIFGVIALGAYLARSRAGRMGLVAMVTTVVGYSLFLMIIGISAFAAAAQGHAYLAGIEEVKQVDYGTAFIMTFFLQILLSFVGNALLAVAIWRSGILPRLAGAVWAAAALLMYPLGLVIGLLVTQTSLPTEPVGGLLIAISGGWMAYSTMRRPSVERVGVQAQPSVQ
jgi:hypothetical protein